MAALAPRSVRSSCVSSRASARPAAFTPARHVLARRAVVVRAQETSVTAGAVYDDTWDAEVRQCNVPVLVDFWAPWCGPCRMIAPLIDEIADEYKGRIKCFKLNTDENPGVATELGIRSIPTVMIFKGGIKQETIIGAVPKTTIVNTVEKFLK